MKDSVHQKFSIHVNIGANEYKALELEVQPEETTDGVPFFVCQTNGIEISQVRRDENNQWEQIWGDLDERTVKNIGKAIEMHDLSRL